jgi:S-adenosylmethionine hydrolase
MPPNVHHTQLRHPERFAGVLKGVIASIAPKAPILDLGHGIPPGDVRAGAFNLWAARDYFPKGSIFVAVVDPGVGGPRDALLVAAHGRRFIGPDNGLLSLAAAGDARRRIRRLDNPAYRLAAPSSTFHGRDVFAPAAARLWSGARPASFGPPLDSLVELRVPWAARDAKGVAGEILHVDAFGNAITSIRAEDLPGSASVTTRRSARSPDRRQAPPAAGSARCRGRSFPLMDHYAAARSGAPLCLVGSCGLLELSLNGASASERLGLRRGDRVAWKPA